MTRLAIALALALVFVWSIPGTIALRWLLLVTATTLLASNLKDIRSLDWRSLATPLLLLATLTCWFITQAAFISPEATWVLGELRGQWLPAMISLLLGMSLGLASRHSTQWPPSILITAVVMVFAAQAGIVVAQSLWHWLAEGSLLRRDVPLTGGPLEMSFLIDLLMVCLAADLFCRATGRSPLLRLSTPMVLATIALALFASYIAASRNGILDLLLLAFLALSLYVYDQRHRQGSLRKVLVLFGLLGLLAAFADINIQSDPRWQKFSGSAALAWQIDTDTGWEQVERHWPLLPDGTPADHSAFIRVAFWRTGLRIIGDHPLGYGYGRNAFGHALATEGHPVRGHAHSGWIDLGVGGGIPGLLLWGALLGVLAVRGLRAFYTDRTAVGLLLFLLVAGYAGRMLLDSVARDHMLQLFLFLTGFLLVLTPHHPREAHGHGR